MKNVLKLFVAFIAIGLLTFGCKKDTVKKNFLKIGDTEYELTAGILENYGTYGGNGAYNIDFTVWTNGITLASNGYSLNGSGQMMYCEMLSSNGTSLVNGEYTLNNSSTTPISFYSGEYTANYNNGSGDWTNFSTGTITVNQSGDTYEIDINCSTSTGVKVTGYYKGSLTYKDYSKKKNSLNIKTLRGK